MQVRVWTVTNQPTELNPARAPAPAESPPVTLAKFDGPTLNSAASSAAVTLDIHVIPIAVSTAGPTTSNYGLPLLIPVIPVLRT